MAHNFVETSIQTEGNDKLHTFLCQHEDQLKTVDKIYELLHENDIDYDELMTYKEIDLRDTLHEIGAKKIVISRMYNLLRTIKTSVIYTQENTVSTKVVQVLVSTEEQSALSNIDKKSAKISELVNHITNAVNNLNENNIKNKNIIETNFRQIVQNVNERKKELILELDNAMNAKKEILLKQKNELTMYQNELNECNNISQKMIKDISLDSQKKKNENIN
eukprot:532873_1